MIPGGMKPLTWAEIQAEDRAADIGEDRAAYDRGEGLSESEQDEGAADAADRWERAMDAQW